MKFGQIIEYKKRNFSFKNHAENEEGLLVPDHFFLKKEKALYEVKVTGL